MKRYSFISVLLLIVLSISLSACGKTETKYDVAERIPEAKQSNAKELVYELNIKGRTKHDTQAYTQGFLVDGNSFLESTGIVGESSLRRLDKQSGAIMKKVDVKGGVFAEGLAKFGNNLYQLTWQNGTCYEYSSSNFAKLREFSYYGEGWGLTNDDKNLYMSDGSNVIRIINPDGFKLVSTLFVTDSAGRSIDRLNELEMINGEIWANVYTTDLVVAIDKTTGKVSKKISLANLRKEITNPNAEVSNGIAFDNKSGKIYMTGKNWETIFEVELVLPK